MTIKGLPEIDPEEYKGVGGWLLLLCIVLTILCPINELCNLYILYKLYPNALVYTGEPIEVIRTLLRIVIWAFVTIYIGFGLWKIRLGAARMAKRFLLFVIVYEAVYAILLTVRPWQPVTLSEARFFIKSVVNVLFFGIWYLYLKKSKRVKATYAS